LSNDTRDIHEQLIEQCRAGDIRAQFRIYKLYSKAMYNVCIRMVVERTVAEEILQDAFVNAFKNMKSVKSSASFGSWLKRIVINRSLDHLRKRKIQMVEINDVTYADFEDEDIISFDLELIHRTIKNLPDGARVVFNLYALENYKHKEIAEMLNISESTSKSQFQRARILLQQELMTKVYE